MLGLPLTVTFDANDGTGTTKVQTVAKDMSWPLSANTFTRRGNHFAGWNTQADGSGAPCADGEKVKLENDITLYAQWQPNEVKVYWPEDMVYAGMALQPGLVVMDSATRKNLQKGADYTVEFENNVNVGEANVTVTFRGDYEYLPPMAGTFRITPRPITVTADNKIKLVGRRDPILTYVVEGLAAGDRLSGKLAREPGEALGVYAITQGTLKADDNYSMTFVGGKLTIMDIQGEGEPQPDVALLARMTVSGSGKTALRVAWTKVAEADGYDVYFARCGRDYGDRPRASVTGCCVRVSGLKARTEYKAYVRAWTKDGGKKVYLGDSPEVHAITGGYNAKHCNAKSVRLNKSSLSLKAGRSATLRASVKGVKSGRKVLGHVRYYSSNVNVAAVSNSGKVKAVAMGSCTVYSIAGNGVLASVKVTVK